MIDWEIVKDWAPIINKTDLAGADNTNQVLCILAGGISEVA